MEVEWKKGGKMTSKDVREAMKIWKEEGIATEKGEREMEDSLTHLRTEVGLIRWKKGERKGNLGGMYVERRHVVEGEKITHIYEINRTWKEV